MQISDELFEQFTEYCNKSDNYEGNTKRAKLLGFTNEDVMVAPGAIIRIKDKNAIGSKTFIGLYSYVNGNVTIGKHVLIGPHCSITAGHHKFSPENLDFSARTENDYDNSIVIGDGSWLASGVTVTAGVKIGRANLICAGAVVTHSTDDFAIMAGVPAKKMGEINKDTGEYIWYNKLKTNGEE